MPLNRKLPKALLPIPGGTKIQTQMSSLKAQSLCFEKEIHPVFNGCSVLYETIIYTTLFLPEGLSNIVKYKTCMKSLRILIGLILKQNIPVAIRFLSIG